MNSERGRQVHGKDATTSGFSRTLEAKARSLARQFHDEPWDMSITAKFRREIAFTLGRMDSVRDLHMQLEKSLRQSECSIATNLMNLTPHAPGYADYRIDSRDKLQNKKLHERLMSRMEKLEGDRRKLTMNKSEKLERLDEELLSLMERHAQLDF